MNKSIRNVIVSLGLIAAPFLSGAPTEKAYVESYAGRADIPVPTSVTMPEVSGVYAGTQVVLEFVVDTAGKPTDFTTVGSVERELFNSLVAAVSNWKFKPVVKDGVAVPSKVRLPMQIVDATGGLLALN